MARPSRVAFRIHSTEPVSDADLHHKITEALPSFKTLNLKAIMWIRDQEGVIVMLQSKNQIMLQTAKRNLGWKGHVETAMQSWGVQIAQDESSRLCSILDVAQRSSPASIIYFQVLLLFY